MLIVPIPLRICTLPIVSFLENSREVVGARRSNLFVAVCSNKFGSEQYGNHNMRKSNQGQREKVRSRTTYTAKALAHQHITFKIIHKGCTRQNYQLLAINNIWI
jgi:hypothetical protein